MSNIDLRQIITDFPDCVTNGEKLKTILQEAYPEVSTGMINVILVISNSGIAKEIQNSVNIDKIATDRWLKKLENDYCMSGSTVEECLQLWINAFTSKFMSPLLNASPTVSESKIYDWIARKEDDDEIDEEFRKIDWESFQALFPDTTDSVSERSLAQEEIENSLRNEKICTTLADYIVNCAYIINIMKKDLGFAYFMLAKGLHICDFYIRDFEPDIMDEPKRSKWSEYKNEISAICELISFKTNNVNKLIEKLLLLSNENGFEAATIALKNSYENEYPYEDVFREWNDYNHFPWFDITCMDEEFNSMNEEFEFENYRPLTDGIKDYYAKKALKISNSNV